MHDPGEALLTEADCQPNLNSVTVAGIVGSDLRRDRNLMRFRVAYRKPWPDGGTTMIAIPVAAKPQEWLQPGMTVPCSRANSKQRPHGAHRASMAASMCLRLRWNAWNAQQRARGYAQPS
jgi:hypothetical protein